MKLSDDSDLHYPSAAESPPYNRAGPPCNRAKVVDAEQIQMRGSLMDITK